MTIIGDINKDGMVSGADVIYLASYIAGIPGFNLSEPVLEPEPEPVPNLNVTGVDIDGYIVNASGEALNFIDMYNNTINEFDTSGVTPLKTFETDSSYGTFNIIITSPPPVIYLQLTGCHDIFTDKPNKNTFTLLKI